MFQEERKNLGKETIQAGLGVAFFCWTSYEALIFEHKPD
jgi:hypothetical protein